MRQADEQIGAGIGFPEFDTADVLVVRSGKLGEPLLRHLSVVSQTAELCTERAEHRRFGLRLVCGRFLPGHALLCTALRVAGRTTYKGYLRMIITSISGNTDGPHSRTDVELMREMCDERAEAFEALFCRYARLVFRVAAGILRDRAEAEDVTQEVFLEIYRKSHLYDPARGSVRLWLLQYAYHRTLRRKAALGRRAAYAGEPLEAADAAIRDERQPLSRDEQRWVLRAGLARLPERQRTTLELACFEDLTLRDVAERLGVSVGCIRHYYYRGLARLRRWARMAEAGVGPGPVTQAAWNGCRDAAAAGRVDAARAPDRPLYARS